MTISTKRTNPYLKALIALVALVGVTAGLVLAASAKTPAHASTTYTVNVVGDQADLKLNDNPNVCDANQLFAGPQCTLRAAIQEANQTIGPDTITFQIPDNPNIPSAEVKTIQIASALPKITERVTIDGYTQNGASPNTLAKGTNAEILIELDGSLAEANADSSLDGLHVSASKTVVKGLAIHSFLDTAIEIEGAATTGVKVKGNFLGTVASGDFGRGGDGVRIRSDANIVGGSAPMARNLISDNLASGVVLLSDRNKVQNNLIGTKKDGVSALGNSHYRVFIQGSSNTVGGTTASLANTIAFNGLDGVTILGKGSKGNRILSNSIFSNDDIGIDLLGNGRIFNPLEGPTANDPGDADSGANNLQNKPVLSSAETQGSTTTIKGTLKSTPNKTFRIQFFSKPFGADPDVGGMNFVGEKFVSTGANGSVAFTFRPSSAVALGDAVTATATTGGNTSEFSAARTVVAQ